MSTKSCRAECTHELHTMQSRVLAGRCCQPVAQPACKASRRYSIKTCIRTRSHRLHVVATSEFWWEDEQEFDALTEMLLPKQIYIATPSACQQQLQQLKASTRFVAAFTPPGLQEQVQELWEQLGRAGPPLFLKVRTRDSLQDCEAEGGSSSAAAAAEQFLQEVASQTWRTELDYGLATGKDATNAAVEEQILVVTASLRGVDCLVQAAVGADSTSRVGSGDVAVVALAGWNQGVTQQQLTSYKQLSPRLLQVASVQSSN